MKKIISRFDWILLLSVCALVGFGILMIYSTTVGDLDKTNFLLRQSVYFVVGLLALVAVIQVGYRNLLGISTWLYVLTVALLIFTYIIGLESRGSVRWIDFGIFTLQGSELAKPVLILFFSNFFVKYPPNQLKNFLFSIILAGIPTLLVFLQPDLGSAFVLFVIWFVLLFLSGVAWQFLASLIVLFAAALPIGFSLLRSYQKERLLTFLNPNQDPLGAGYNIVQSIIAVGSGQFFGRGFGRGTQSHLNFLPEQKTDFIFATTAEELGFVGIAAILSLFSLIIYRCVRVAIRATNKAASLLVYGSISVIAIQLFVNSGMNMGLVPVTGITLPFISFGGSSLVSMLAMIGLVISVDLESKS